MRRQAFQYQEPPSQSDGLRHRARQFNFDDQSIFTYAHANKHWWGYA